MHRSAAAPDISLVQMPPQRRRHASRVWNQHEPSLLRQVHRPGQQPHAKMAKTLLNRWLLSTMVKEHPLVEKGYHRPLVQRQRQQHRQSLEQEDPLRRRCQGPRLLIAACHRSALPRHRLHLRTRWYQLEDRAGSAKETFSESHAKSWRDRRVVHPRRRQTHHQAWEAVFSGLSSPPGPCSLSRRIP